MHFCMSTAEQFSGVPLFPCAGSSAVLNWRVRQEELSDFWGWSLERNWTRPEAGVWGVLGHNVKTQILVTWRVTMLLLFYHNWNQEVRFSKSLQFFPAAASPPSPSCCGPDPSPPSNNSIILQPLQQVWKCNRKIQKLSFLSKSDYSNTVTKRSPLG